MTILYFIRTYVMWVLDVLIMAWIILQLYKFIKGSRSMQLVKGIGLILIVFLASKLLYLNSLHWILTYLLNYGIIVLVIVFQPEFRRLLVKVGESRFLGAPAKDRELLLNELTDAVTALAKKKTGALLVIQQADFLGTIVDTGQRMNAILSAKLIASIFIKKSLLHDGAIVLNYDRIEAAGCILPLTDDPNLDKSIGTRHRAAIGMSEESDAVVIVVSEETGKISFAVRGELEPVSQTAFKDRLEKLLEGQDQRRSHGSKETA